MFSESDFEVARSIMECLQLPVEEFTDTEDVLNSVYSDIQDCMPELDFTIESGATRLVIVPYAYSFVIKIAFDGTWEYNEDEDEEFFSSFYYDYNEKEMETINSMRLDGFGALVPDMAYLGQYYRHSVYIQELIPYGIYSDKRPQPNENSLETSRSMSRQFSHCDIKWRAMVVEKYGEEFWKSFVNWDFTNHMRIFDDMHANNYGYRANGDPVFLDVGGYDH